MGLRFCASMEMIQSAPSEFAGAERPFKKVPAILLDSLVEEPRKPNVVPNHLLESSEYLVLPALRPPSGLEANLMPTRHFYQYIFRDPVLLFLCVPAPQPDCAGNSLLHRPRCSGDERQDCAIVASLLLLQEAAWAKPWSMHEDAAAFEGHAFLGFSSSPFPALTVETVARGTWAYASDPQLSEPGATRYNVV